MGNLEKTELIQQLKAEGITDDRVLKAMAQVPREQFVPSYESQYAYKNIPLPIGNEQTISQPYIVAIMTQALFEHPNMHKVLEIGTGSGYQAAILSTLAKEVYTIERIQDLYQQSSKVLADLGYNNIHTLHADGSEGWEDAAPFDGIIVTACSPSIPNRLLEQLSPNGRIIAPVGSEFKQQLIQVDRDGDEYHTKILEYVRFVPLKPGKA